MRWPRSRPNIAEVAPSRVSTPSAGTRAISLSMSAASSAAGPRGAAAGHDGGDGASSVRERLVRPRVGGGDRARAAAGAPATTAPRSRSSVTAAQSASAAAYRPRAPACG